MTTVYPISSAMPSTKPATTPSADDSGNNTLNQDTFLTLLVAQLKYQDPMNPADSTEFLSQTAQFTQVEKLGQIADMMQAAGLTLPRPPRADLAGVHRAVIGRKTAD